MIKIYPTKFNGTLRAPASKAHAQRLLFMASMPTFPTVVKNVPLCDDIDTTVSCLMALGSKVEIGQDGREIKVYPFPKTSPLPEFEFNFKESATTARLAVALCAAMGAKASCKAQGTLPRRSLIQLTGRLAVRGVTFSSFSLPFTQSGRIAAGDYPFAGDQGSQSISALMMFLPILLNDSRIIFETPLVDRSFIDITKNALDAFKIELTELENGYSIHGKQYYESPGEISCENDWGLAAMWQIAALACGESSDKVVIEGLDRNSPQYYREAKDACALLQFDFKDINIDVSKMPSLTPLLCALAIVKGATIRLSGAPQLKQKETNELSVMADIARQFGQDAQLTDDGITILGNGEPKYSDDIIIDTKGDPWVFMAMALSAATLKQPITLSDEHGADKIYRDFLRDYQSVGGKYEII